MILDTGGTGLVGAHLLYHLAKTAPEIRAIYRTEEKIISYVGKIKEFEVASGKTLTPDQFAKLFVLLTRSEDQAKFLLEHADFLLS